MKKSLIYGTLLGDAWIYKDKKGNYLFAFQQSNKEYAKWKAQELGLPYREYRVSRLDKRTGKVYKNLTIHVKLSPDKKRELHSLFYCPKKIVSLEILNELTPKGIALWYMDDGSIYYNGNTCHLTLSTDGFTSIENDLIVRFFADRYSIRFTKTKKRIRLTSKKECEKFMKLTERFIPGCMRYKTLKVAIHNYKEKRNANSVLG